MQSGSHHQYHHPAKPGTVTIAGKPNDDVESWIWSSIMKQAGLRRDKR